MCKENVLEAERALTEKPLLATTAERFLILDEIKSMHKELSHPRRFSWMLGELLSRVSVPLMPYDMIAGRTVDRLLTDEENERFCAFVRHADFPDGASFLSSGHATYSWETLVNIGIPGASPYGGSLTPKIQKRGRAGFSYRHP